MSGVFRKEYRELSVVEATALDNMKTTAEELYEFFSGEMLSNNPGYQREMALARTKLEEAVMWGTKAITG